MESRRECEIQADWHEVGAAIFPPCKSRVIARFLVRPLDLHGGFAVNYWRSPATVGAVAFYLPLADDAGAPPL